MVHRSQGVSSSSDSHPKNPRDGQERAGLNIITVMTTINTMNTSGGCRYAPSSITGSLSYFILILCQCIAITTSIIIIGIIPFKDESTEIGEGRQLDQSHIVRKCLTMACYRENPSSWAPSKSEAFGCYPQLNRGLISRKWNRLPLPEFWKWFFSFTHHSILRTFQNFLPIILWGYIWYRYSIAAL